MTTKRTHEEIAKDCARRIYYDEVAKEMSAEPEWLRYVATEILAALREAADGRCSCRLEGEPGRETIIHECQVHAESRLRYAGQAADAAREEVIAKANEAWLEGHDEAALNATDLKCRIKDLLLERRRAEAALAKWAEHECESHTGCAEALVAARQEEREALDVLRDLLATIIPRTPSEQTPHQAQVVAWLDARSRAAEGKV